MSAVDISVEDQGFVSLITLHRPPNNHIDLALVTALADALEALARGGACRAVVLASEGKNFCGGADIVQPQGLVSGDGTGIAPFYDAAARLFTQTLPLIAAVQGAAVGAGLGLAAACDFRIAAENARFSANFVKLGFHPGFGLSATLPRLIGVQNAGLMMLTGRRFGAEAALGMGLVDDVVETETLLGRAVALAQEIAEAAPLAVASTRASLRAGLAEAFKAATAHEFSEQSRLMRTEDFREGVRSVAERRPGVFVGR